MNNRVFAIVGFVPSKERRYRVTSDQLERSRKNLQTISKSELNKLKAENKRLKIENEDLDMHNQKLRVDGVNDEAYLLTCLDIIRKTVGLPQGYNNWQHVVEEVEKLKKGMEWLIDQCTRRSAIGYCPIIDLQEDLPCDKMSCKECFHITIRETVEQINT